METPISVVESSQVSQARRHARDVAQAHGLSEDLQGKVALVVTEAATNLVKYGRNGYIIARAYEDGAEAGMEVLALDSGPGMPDTRLSLNDGYSTGGSLGVGLGTIARLSSCFEIYSTDDRGTALLSRLRDERRPTAAPSRDFGLAVSGLSVAKEGQEACGDAWTFRRMDGALWVMAVDGLGHGPHAATASAAAVRVLHDSAPDATPYDVLRAAHKALKATRGAVMAVAAIRPVIGTMEFAGVGNITAALVEGDNQRRLPSTDGIVGYGVHSIREQSYAWSARSMLVLTSDGLSSRWNLAGQTALAARHPSLVAGVMHRDHSRSNDDATVVVVKGTTP
ncbi:ATP-binding SpoIIE family protein phosphatase [Bordetella genomosp. 13]|uniref:ATP-binding SpoIIE family protein phosphatase n=1 Tax=Bordetella genomosp. 13 TaxID=463040 RepID=UPI0011A8E088|nr:ATP-binding SpoIIE family protein phosphatase [Bordetella genomosp. 13]